MDIFYVLIIAFSLGIDAFSVALGAGAFLVKTNQRQRFRLSFHFGLFQFMMPLIGWYAGSSVASLISSIDHWVVLILLSVVGGKMIHDACSDGDDDVNTDITKGYKLVALSVATSIDALAVGFSIALIKGDIFIPAIIIGIVAAIMTLIGMLIGEKASVRHGKKAQIFGGIVLILIGLKIVIEHTF